MALTREHFNFLSSIRRLGNGVLIASILWLFIWLGKSADRWQDGYSFQERQWDYYSLMVDGFLLGKASLHLTPEIYPHLRADGTVPDRVSAPLDTSPYKGRVYLYYGVVPAVSLFVPHALLTGGDLSLNAATVLFVITGYLLSLAWYFRSKHRILSRVPIPIEWACILMLGFVPATSFLVRRSMFYELPLAAGYLFLVAAIFAWSEALVARLSAVRWVALASLMIGVAAGCHPIMPCSPRSSLSLLTGYEPMRRAGMGPEIWWWRRCFLQPWPG